MPPRYRRTRSESFTFAQARALDGTCQAQILASLAIRSGVLADDMETMASTLAADFGVAEADLVLDRVTFTREGEAAPTYEMWLYFEEHGVVCIAGSSNATPVHCVQSNFWSTDPEDPESVELAEALNAST